MIYNAANWEQPLVSLRRPGGRLASEDEHGGGSQRQLPNIFSVWRLWQLSAVPNASAQGLLSGVSSSSPPPRAQSSLTGQLLCRHSRSTEQQTFPFCRDTQGQTRGRKWGQPSLEHPKTPAPSTQGAAIVTPWAAFLFAKVRMNNTGN